MDKKIKRWIKIMTLTRKIWGCHQKPERSFVICGYQFPLCARCTGVLVGYFCAFAFLAFKFIMPTPVCVLLLFPLIIDGSVQMFFSIMSNNIRRFVTGLIFGIGLIQLVANILIYIF